MKVHFIGPLEGDKTTYSKIVEYINLFGYGVVTDHSLQRTIQDVEKESVEDAELYAKRMSRWVKEADIIVVEATRSVLGAGFEISSALQIGKSVIVLYKPQQGNTPHVLKGISDDRLQVIAYSDETLKEVLKLALEYASEKQDVRFTMLMPPDIIQFLDDIDKRREISRSEYIRKLIRAEMERKL